VLQYPTNSSGVPPVYSPRPWGNPLFSSTIFPGTAWPACAVLPLRRLVRCKGQKHDASSRCSEYSPRARASSPGPLALCLMLPCALANVREMREKEEGPSDQARPCVALRLILGPYCNKLQEERTRLRVQTTLASIPLPNNALRL